MANETKESKDRVYTTNDMAASLGMTGKQLRRYLRKTEKFNDGVYTRYAWTFKEYQAMIKQVKEMIAKKQKEEKKESK